MSRFEKIIIPFVDNTIKPEDFTKDAGFIDVYTSDPDKPSGDKEIFIVYDDRVRTKQSIDRARRFWYGGCVKRRYIKYVDSVPYMIYSFWVNPTTNGLYKKVIHLTPEQKIQILQFWGASDPIVSDVLSLPMLYVDIEDPMPIADYVPNTFAGQTGLTVDK